MRTPSLIVFITPLCSLVSCNDQGTAPVLLLQPPSVVFTTWLADTLNNPATVFQAGQSFKLQYTLANRTGNDLACYFHLPLDFFYLLLDDSLVASSRWGQPVPTDLWIKRSFPKDSTIANSWIGPNDPWRRPTISLPPGTYTYQIRVYIKYLDSVQVTYRQLSTDTLLVVP